MIITSIGDLRSLAKRRVPRALFHYADGGSYDEITLHRNRRDLEAISFRQRVAVDVSRQALSTTIVGQPLSMPLLIAPTGLAEERPSSTLWPRAAVRASASLSISSAETSHSPEAVL